jgi:hypothetical protein
MVSGTMICLIVTNRADDRILFGDFGQLGHVLANLHPGHIGIDRPEFAAYFYRRLRLQIKGLQVSWTTIHPDQDAIGFWFVGPGMVRGRRLP